MKTTPLRIENEEQVKRDIKAKIEKAMAKGVLVLSECCGYGALGDIHYGWGICAHCREHAEFKV